METWVFVVVSIGGSVVAAVGTGLFTLRGVANAARHRDESQRRAEEATIKATCQAICDEVSVLWRLFSTGMGAAITQIPHGGPLNLYFAVSDSYFKVYENNTGLIGKIKDNIIRNQIVISYSEAIGLLDSIKMNNYLLQRKDNFYFSWRQSGSLDDETKKIHEECFVILANYAPAVRNQYDNVKREIEKLLKLFEHSGYNVPK